MQYSFAFPRQQWLHERTLLLRKTYIVGLLLFFVVYLGKPSLSTLYFVVPLVHDWI